MLEVHPFPQYAAAPEQIDRANMPFPASIPSAPFPVSGYATSVDWGASALLEFTYLDLILNRGMAPAEAAAKLPLLIRYAGDSAPRGSPYPAAGFRFFPAAVRA